MEDPQPHPVRREKSAWWLVPLLGVAVLVVFANLLFGSAWNKAHDPTGDLADPLPFDGRPCRVAEGSALARAQALEGLGDASWERLPFDQREAPRAVLRMVESENCYRACGDREGIQRTSIKRRTFESDLRRRWARTKLMLELARRRGDAEGMRREIASLLALSSQAGDAALPYHDSLRRLDRAAEAQLLESKAKED